MGHIFWRFVPNFDGVPRNPWARSGNETFFVSQKHIKVVCLYECLNVRYDFGGSAGSVMFGLGMGWEVSVELGFGVG